MDRLAHLGHGVNVAIVGAGWAGMAAAATLAERNIPVTVFESARHIGGRARRVEIQGMELDNGQHILIGAYAETLRLMRLVGADVQALLLRLPLSICYPGKFSLRAPRLPAPLHLLAAMLTATGLSLRERIAAMRFIATMRGAAYRIAADICVRDLLAQHAQAGAIARYLWEPLCVASLNTPVESASAQVFLNVLRDALDGSRENSDFLIPRADLGKLFPEPAAAYVCANAGSVRLGSPVRALNEFAEGFMLDERPERYTHVILAVGPHQLDGLIEAFPALAHTRQCVAALAYEPIYTCYLQYDERISMPQAMTGFEGGMIQWVFDRGRLNGNRGLLAAVISARGEHQNVSQDVVANSIHREIAAFLPGLPEPLWVRTIAEKRATFSCRPGVVRPQNKTALRNLFLAGDYTASEYPATLEAAIRSGVHSAQLVCETAAT